MNSGYSINRCRNQSIGASELLRNNVSDTGFYKRVGNSFRDAFVTDRRLPITDRCPNGKTSQSGDPSRSRTTTNVYIVDTRPLVRPSNIGPFSIGRAGPARCSGRTLISLRPAYRSFSSTYSPGHLGSAALVIRFTPSHTSFAHTSAVLGVTLNPVQPFRLCPSSSSFHARSHNCSYRFRISSPRNMTKCILPIIIRNRRCILSSLVTHPSILVSTTLYFLAQHSEPYNVAGLTTILYN